MGGEFFTDFKSLNGIEISWLVQVFSNFKWFRGSTPLGGGGWVDRGGGGYGCGGMSHAHMHAHTHTHMHARTCMLNMLNIINMDASMTAAICNFYTCINVCVCMCVHVRVCGNTSPCSQMPPTHLPPPWSCREPKTPKFNKSWTNRDNSILFEDSLPLNIPELI